MERIDIVQNRNYIKEFICVIRSGSSNPSRKLYHKNRYSDAFVYILSGSCRYTFEDGIDFTVNQGDILYLAQNADYAMHILTSEFYFIYCDFSFACENPRQSAVYTPENPSHAENVFLKLLHSYHSTAETVFAECMALLYQIYGMVVKTRSVFYLVKSTESRISAAKERMDKNLTDLSLSVAMLADEAEMSEVYFRKLFKKKYQMSPARYLISARVKYSKQLLSYPFITIEECAIQSGFSSAQYFCRVFKEETGITPTQYRKQ